MNICIALLKANLKLRFNSVYQFFNNYKYKSIRYKGSFITKEVSIQKSFDIMKHVDRVIYVFWTGHNEITSNRKRNIEVLKQKCGVEVKLITPDNLVQYIKEEDPLPEAFDYLSLVHKSDYLRSYFMHHYGGGYADIKEFSYSWIPAFDKLDNSSAYAIGYPEVGEWGVAYQKADNPLLQEDLRKNWRCLIGNGAFICRPYTPFTELWHDEARRRVESHTLELKLNPADNPFAKADENKGYPLWWSEIQGSIFHPLCLRFNNKILQSPRLLPLLTNYR